MVGMGRVFRCQPRQSTEIVASLRMVLVEVALLVSEAIALVADAECSDNYWASLRLTTAAEHCLLHKHLSAVLVPVAVLELCAQRSVLVQQMSRLFDSSQSVRFVQAALCWQRLKMASAVASIVDRCIFDLM